jgi:hypothetical protein
MHISAYYSHSRVHIKFMYTYRQHTHTITNTRTSKQKPHRSIRQSREHIDHDSPLTSGQAPSNLDGFRTVCLCVCVHVLVREQPGMCDCRDLGRAWGHGVECWYVLVNVLLILHVCILSQEICGTSWFYGHVMILWSCHDSIVMSWFYGHVMILWSCHDSMVMWNALPLII